MALTAEQSLLFLPALMAEARKNDPFDAWVEAILAGIRSDPVHPVVGPLIDPTWNDLLLIFVVERTLEDIGVAAVPSAVPFGDGRIPIDVVLSVMNPQTIAFIKFAAQFKDGTLNDILAMVFPEAGVLELINQLITIWEGNPLLDIQVVQAQALANLGRTSLTAFDPQTVSDFINLVFRVNRPCRVTPATFNVSEQIAGSTMAYQQTIPGYANWAENRKIGFTELAGGFGGLAALFEALGVQGPFGPVHASFWPALPAGGCVSPPSYESLLLLSEAFDLPKDPRKVPPFQCKPVQYTMMTATSGELPPPFEGPHLAPPLEGVHTTVIHRVEKAMRIVHGTCWKRFPFITHFDRPLSDTEQDALDTIDDLGSRPAEQLTPRQRKALADARSAVPPIPADMRERNTPTVNGVKFVTVPGIFEQVSDQIRDQLAAHFSKLIPEKIPELDCGPNHDECIKITRKFDLAQPHFSSDSGVFRWGAFYSTNYSINISGENAGAIYHRIANAIYDFLNVDFDSTIDVCGDIPGLRELCLLTIGPFALAQKAWAPLVSWIGGLAGTGFAELAILMGLADSEITVNAGFSLEANQGNVVPKILYGQKEVQSNAAVGRGEIKDGIGTLLRNDCADYMRRQNPKNPDISGCAIEQIRKVLNQQRRFPLAGLQKALDAAAKETGNANVTYDNSCSEETGAASWDCFNHVLGVAQQLDGWHDVPGWNIGPKMEDIVRFGLRDSSAFECRRKKCFLQPPILGINILPKELEIVLGGSTMTDASSVESWQQAYYLGWLYERLKPLRLSELCDAPPRGPEEAVTSGYIATWHSGNLPYYYVEGPSPTTTQNDSRGGFNASSPPPPQLIAVDPYPCRAIWGEKIPPPPAPPQGRRQ